MKSSIQGMESIARLYEKLYGLKLSLLEDRKILVRATVDVPGEKLEGWLGWIRDNKQHVIERLKMEGWE